MQTALQYPAVACDHTSGITIYAGTLYNNSGSPQSLSCPLATDTDGQGTYFPLVAAFIKASGVSCWIVIVERSGAFFIVNPSTTAHYTGYDQPQWSFNAGSNMGHHAALECFLATNGSWVSGYYLNSFTNDYF